MVEAASTHRESSLLRDGDERRLALNNTQYKHSQAHDKSMPVGLTKYTRFKAFAMMYFARVVMAD
jgi:hypothetical protein